MTKVRWGLIGCGDIARKRVAPALRDIADSEIVAISRAQSHLAESFAKQFEIEKWYGEWRDLLRDDEINAVYVATPVHLHAPQTIAAAEAGKHVLCEKPMALNTAECDEMIDACRANNVKLGIAYYRHFYPAVERIRDFISSGEIGDPILAEANAFEWFNARPDEPRSWLLRKNLSGGGPMFDFGCHRIEVLAHLLGEIVKVQASLGNVLFDREVEDTAIALLQFARGTRAVLTVTHAAREPQDTLDIFASRGSIHVPVLNDGKIKIVTENGERIESHPPAGNIHQPLIEDFVAAVLSDRAPKVGGQIGRMVAAVEEKIYRE